MQKPSTSLLTADGRVSRLLAAAGVASAGILAETLSGEARRRRHGHNRGRDNDDRKDEHKEDRKDNHDRGEDKDQVSPNGDNDEGGNNHDVDRVAVAAPPAPAPAESRLDGKHDRPDDIAFVS